MSFSSRSILLLSFIVVISVKCSCYPDSDGLWRIIKPYDVNKEAYRLPNDTKPLYYNVVLEINPDTADFKGNVTINVQIQNDNTKYIVLHSGVDDITDVSVTNKNGNIYTTHELSNDDKDFLNITIDSQNEGSNVTVKISFTSEYSRNVDGLYLSEYDDGVGEKKKLAVTQMAPSSARKVFPCYDEPGIKAVFKMNVYSPSKYTVFSNEDNVNINANNTELPPILNGMTLTSFKETQPMSTYLIAILVSDYGFKSNVDEQSPIFNKKYRILAKKSMMGHTSFAHEFGQNAMKKLENYTQVPYGLSKLDNAALPNLFYNAMENWGLIIYREGRLLYDKNSTITKELQSIATVIAHESAHMWFGDHVSPLWWDYVWLNEGFATYFESFITNEIYPQWGIMEQFTINNLHRAMVFDAQETTNAMTNLIGSPEDASNNFNIIAYQKAGSVIRMISYVMGKNIFRTGLTNYLNNNKYGTVVPQNLFVEFDAAIGNKELLPKNTSLGEIFSSWSDQKGVPVVTAFKIQNSNSIGLVQERLYENNSLSSNEKWWIPITWTTFNDMSFDNTTTQDWFNPNSGMLKIDMNLTNDREWYIINKQQIGYYRVNYLDNNWELLSKALSKDDFDGIHLLNRAQILDDALFFSKKFELSYNITFDIMKYLKNETHYIPWHIVNIGFNHLTPLMEAAENTNKYKLFIKQLSEDIYKNLTFDRNDNDDHMMKLQKPIIVSLLCGAYDEQCLNDTNEMLISYTNGSVSRLDIDLKEVIYCYGMRRLPHNLWTNYWNKYINPSTSNDEKQILGKCLGYSDDVQILRTYMTNIFSDNFNSTNAERTQLTISMINAGRTSFEIVLNITNNLISTIKPKLNLNSVLKELGEKAATEYDENMLSNICKNSNLSADEKKFCNEVLDKVKVKRSWLKLALQDIDPWLEENVSRGSESFRISFTLFLFTCLSLFVNKLF